MREKLYNHFLKIGPRRCVVGIVILLIILDILNGIYLKASWELRDASHQMVVVMIKLMKASPTDFDNDTMREMTGLVDKAFDFMLFLVMMNNLFFYLFYLRKKLWAQGYVLFYTLTAGFFSLTMLFDGLSMGWGWMIFNLLTIPLYFYLYMAVKLLRKETTLEPKKKGR